MSNSDSDEEDRATKVEPRTREMLSPAALVEAFSRRAQTVPSFEKFSAPSGDDADTAEEVHTPKPATKIQVLS